MPISITHLMARALGEGGHVVEGEEAVVALAALHVFGDQARVGEALGEDLLEVELVGAFAHHQDQNKYPCSFSRRTKTSTFSSPATSPTAT